MLERYEIGTDGNKRAFAIAADLTEVQRWLASTPSKWSGQSSKGAGYGLDWDLGANWTETLRLAQEGWTKGAEMLSDKLAAHFPERDHVDSWRYDVAGELPDIGRFLAGDPAHMRRHGHPKGRTPVISMLINICCSGSISAKRFANYGAALCSVIDQLENSGRRVELNVAWISNFGQARAVCGWTAKRAEDPLDLAAIAFSIAHPACSRRICFGMCERLPIRENQSYGMPARPTVLDWPDAPEGMYLLQGVGHLSDTFGSALEQVVREVNLAAGEDIVTVEG